MINNSNKIKLLLFKNFIFQFNLGNTKDKKQFHVMIIPLTFIQNDINTSMTSIGLFHNYKMKNVTN